MSKLYNSVKEKERADHLREGYENSDHDTNRHKSHMLSKVIVMGIMLILFIMILLLSR